MQELVCVFTNKRPSVAAKMPPASNNVPVQAFRSASNIRPKTRGQNRLGQSAQASYAYTVFRGLAPSYTRCSSAIATAVQITLVTMPHKNRESTS